jgi:hypothetical protein
MWLRIRRKPLTCHKPPIKKYSMEKENPYSNINEMMMMMRSSLY